MGDVDLQGKKILIVEDDFYIRDLYQRQLTKEGLEVQVCEDGETAFRILTEFTPDLVILDLMLPKKSGFDILKEIKGSKETENTVVLLLTNVSQDASIKEGFKLGADGYLVKAAYTPNQVVEEVKKYLVER